MKVVLTRVTQDPIMAIEEAASNCYNSVPDGSGKIMRHCIKSGHQSVTEFCDFTFHIEGISRALSHQLVRHRLASYAQRSQRYCSEGGFGYVVPKSIAKDPLILEHYNALMVQIADTYEMLQKLDVPNEDARMVLPNACETQIEVKMNLRVLMNFMNERLCTCAQWEIRELALAMKRVIIEKYPELEPYLVPKCEKYGKEFGFCTETKQRREQLKCNKHPRLADVFEDYTHYRELCDS